MALPDGGLAVNFVGANINNHAAPEIVELNSDGTTNSSFNLDSTLVFAVPEFVYPDGRMIIWGTDAQMNTRYIRLLANGTVDVTFTPTTFVDPNNLPQVVEQADGKLLYYQANGFLERFNSDGTLDSSFTSPLDPSSTIQDVALQTDGKIVVSGTLKYLHTTTQHYFLRLNSDGSADNTFVSSLDLDNQVNGGISATPQPDGHILVETYSIAATGPIYRLDSSGNVDSSFSSGLPAQLTSLAKPSRGGKLYFVSSNSGAQVLQRLNSDGTLDGSFIVTSSSDLPIYLPKTWDDAHLYFWSFTDSQMAAHKFLTETDGTGAISSTFNLVIGTRVTSIVFNRQDDGKYLLSSADFVNGTAEPSGAAMRLNSNGSIDSGFQVQTFNPGNSFVSLQPLASGAVIGAQGTNLVQQTSTGALVLNTALPMSGTPVFAPDGSFYEDIPNTGLIRYKADGTVDNTFTTTLDRTASYKIFPAPDGTVYIDGSKLFHLKHDGSVDPKFPGEFADFIGTSDYVFPDSSVLRSTYQTLSVYKNHQFVNVGINTYTHYGADGAVLYTYQSSGDSSSLAGVLYDRMKAINSSGHISSGNTDGNAYILPFDVTASGQLTVIESDGSNGAVLSRYIPANSSQPSVPLAPSIVQQPYSAGISTGTDVSLIVYAVGLNPFTYQWYFQGAAIPGATSSVLNLNSIAPNQFGDYRVTVANSAGSITSDIATLTSITGPTITHQPISVVSSIGESANFEFNVDSIFADYHWQVRKAGETQWTYLSDGYGINGAWTSQLSIATVTADLVSASFRCIAYDSNTEGTSISSIATLNTPDAPAPISVAKFSNISTRAYVGTGASIEIGGFIISGSQPKQVLIRGLGPQLTGEGVKNALTDPVLKVFSGQTQIATNDDWSSDPTNAASVTSASVVGNAIAFPNGSKDAALVLTLNPGVGYTAQLTGKNGTTGIGMIEVYDADSTASKLINISTRSETQTGAGIQIAGFIISGTEAKKVLIRALGPTLTQSSVKGVLDDPVLSLFSGQTKINENDDWSSTTDNTSAVEAATTSANAVALAHGTTDSAMVVTLAPGGYTAQVSGKNGHTGVTLIEVYEVP